MAQNLILIWLDNSIDENNVDCQNTIIQLRRSVNTIKIFTDSETCIEFIENVSNEKICMILSDSLGQQIMPRVHDMFQIISIFIFRADRKRYEEWGQEWSKINGMFTEIVPICEALKKAAQQYEQNATSISFMATSTDAGKKNLNRLDCSFMYTQILKEILLTIKFEKKHITEFVGYCRQQFVDNDRELQNIKKLERYYDHQTPIWWYTCECFLYPMLNRALRTMDVDIIIKMGFFIVDLHHHIKELHNKQFRRDHYGNIFTVYRGQGLSKTDFDQMMNTKGGLIAFNNFLSTSKDRNVSLSFARNTLVNPDMVGILFVMTVDPSQSTTPFASVTDAGCHGGTEYEILFSMHTVFRVKDIKSISANHRLYQVDLTLTSDNDKDLRMLTESMRKETGGSIGWFRLGVLLRKMGQFDKAEQVYQVLLEQTTDDNEKGPIYDRLGKAKEDRGEYQEAIKLYKKAIEIHQNTLPPHHLSLATSLNNIGVAYEKTGQYSNALVHHEKALEIKHKTLPLNHPDLGASYTNIGVVYRKMGNYSKALSCYGKSLEIKQQSLPSNHPDLAKCYINHGIVYVQMGEYKKALSYFEKAVEIQQQSLLPNHPDFGMSYNNMAIAYRKLGEYSKALSYYEKVLEIQQQTLPPNHPHFTMSYINMALVYKNIDDYSEALSSYEKALAIQQQLLPSNHPDLAKSYSNIGNVYDNMSEYPKALSYYDKALEIKQQSLPPDDLSLSVSYNNIGLVYKNMGIYLKAYSFFEHAVEIGQRSLPSHHSDLQDYKKNLQDVKEKLS